jgi:hypothetical protein
MASLNPIGREKRKIDCSRVGRAIHEPVAVVPAALSIKNSPGEMFRPTLWLDCLTQGMESIHTTSAMPRKSLSMVCSLAC